MKNRSWGKVGLIVSLGLALSACAQQGHQAMMESQKGMMNKDGNMNKEQMKDQNKDAM
jgi:hypothetical protein